MGKSIHCFPFFDESYQLIVHKIRCIFADFYQQINIAETRQQRAFPTKTAETQHSSGF